MQRRIETAVRRQKDAAIAANAAGDDVLRRECQAKINGIQKRYGAVSRAAGLDVQKERMTVSGFHRVKTREELASFVREQAKQAAAASEARASAVRKARGDIQSGKISRKINREKQARHMAGDKGYLEGCSVITASMDRLQELVNMYAGTGKIEVLGKELNKVTETVDFHEMIGYTVNREGESHETTWVKIHYGKTGNHVVPFRSYENDTI